MPGSFAGWYYEQEGWMVGPASLEQVCDLLAVGKTAKVWKASKEGDDIRFYRIPPQMVLNSCRRTEQVGQPT